MTEKRSWAEIQFVTGAEHEDMACWLMIQQGASGTAVESLDEGKVRLNVSFPEESLPPEQLDSIKAAMEEYGLSSSLPSLHVRSVYEEDWLAKWKEGFEPFAIGEKFCICPPWFRDTLSEELKRDRHVIYIEPGMAFGTGLHATTQYCMVELEKESASKMVADIGTGSAILAIAYAKLHPDSEIWAVDNDPVAMEVAETNCALNEVADKINLLTGSTEVLDGKKFDCILSNLTCEDIIALLPDYEKLLAPAGSIVCAGVLTEKLHLLEAALAKHNMKVARSTQNGMWTGLTCVFN